MIVQPTDILQNDLYEFKRGKTTNKLWVINHTEIMDEKEKN